ncbi:MAG: hypothetical protein O3C28_13120 [Proteobacteria bacterium]|nr:hypothetical protein [Pseudomonadota bacterium]
MNELLAQNTAPPDPDTAIAQARQLLSSLSNEAPTSRFAAVGREFGQLVDALRQANPTTSQLTTMRVVTEDLSKRTNTHLKALETQAGRDEVALETLYRSAAWDDISFALAAFPYWRAWLDLEMVNRADGVAAKKQWIWEAKKGFRGTAVQVFRPSLLYGGWLGLGYVALAEGEDDRAVKIFESLEKEVASDTAHPLHDVVSLELRMLRAKAGNVIDSAPNRDINDAEAQVLRAEAIALLEYAQKYKKDPKDAVVRLRRIIDAGYVDNAMLELVSHYHDTIKRGEIGILTALVRAEQAFEFGLDSSATGLYEMFFEAVENRKDLNLNQYRFNYALASLNIKAYEVAAVAADELLKKQNLDPLIKRAATKLAYVARVSRDAAPTAASRAALTKSAERLLRDYPDDRDADGVRLTVAQTTTDSKKAHAMMNAVKSPRGLQGSLEQTRFFIIARDFSDAIRSNDVTKATAFAPKGLSAYQQLPKKQREITENLALVLQMRALSDADPKAVITAIDEFQNLASLALPVRQGMLWAQLRCVDRLADPAALIDFLSRFTSTELEAWQLEQIYSSINAVADTNERLAATQVLLQGTMADDRMEQRFKMIMIEALLDLDQFSDAYDQARLFREAYPALADGYRLFALAAAKTDRPFEADSAWRAITDRTDPRRDMWWEGMLHRAHIRAESTRPESTCEVLAEIESRIEFMPPAIKPQVEDLRGSLTCPQNQTS